LAEEGSPGDCLRLRASYSVAVLERRGVLNTPPVARNRILLRASGSTCAQLEPCCQQLEPSCAQQEPCRQRPVPVARNWSPVASNWNPLVRNWNRVARNPQRSRPSLEGWGARALSSA